MQPQVPDRAHISQGCSLHAGRAFVAICRRCGAYMCDLCNEAGRYNACQACRAREQASTPQRAHAEPLRLRPLLAHSLAAYKANLGLITLALLVVALVMGLPSALLALVATFLGDPFVAIALSGALGLVQIVVFHWLLLGLLELGLHVARGEPASLQLLLRGGERLGSGLLYAFVQLMVNGFVAALVALPLLASFFPNGSTLSGTLIALGVVVLLVVWTYVALGFCFGFPELVAQRHIGALQAVQNSFALARARRMRIAAGLSLLTLLAMFGTMLCYVGLLFTMGYGLVFYCSLYLALRSQAERAP